MLLITNNLIALQLIIPFFAALTASLCSNKIVKPLSIIFSTVSLIISLSITIKNLPINYFFGQWTSPYAIEYKIENLDLVFLLLVNIIGFFGIIYGYNSEEISTSNQNLYYALYLLAIVGMIGIILTNDIFNIYVFLEIFSLSSYSLAAISKNKNALINSFNYLTIGSISACFILTGIGFIYSQTGSLNLTSIQNILLTQPSSSSINVAIIFIIMGTLLKTGIFPIHNWIVNLYSTTTRGVTFLLSGLASKISIYILIKIIYKAFDFSLLKNYNLDFFLQLIFALTILICSIFACYEAKVKKILAFSSLVNHSYIALAMTIDSYYSLLSIILLSIGHSLSKPLLFMMTDKKNTSFLSKLCLFFNCANLAALPLTLGFFSKWYLLNALIKDDLFFILVITAISSLFALIYSYKLFASILYNQSSNIISSTKISLIVTSITIINIAFSLYYNLIIKS